DDRPIAAWVALAFARVTMALRGRQCADAPGEAAVGAVAYFNLRPPPVAEQSDEDLLAAANAARLAIDADFAQRLVDASDLVGDEGYMLSWADRVGQGARAVPADAATVLRQHVKFGDTVQVGGRVVGSKCDFAKRPFTARPRPQRTVPAPRSAQPARRDGPQSLADAYQPGALDCIRRHAQATADGLQHVKDGHTTRPGRIEPLCLGRSAIKPAAQGVVWDNRPESRVNGRMTPLRTESTPTPQFNVDFLKRYLRDYPDQMLADAIINGAPLHADIPHQTVSLPHLRSIADGYPAIDAEIKKLIDDGRVQVYDELPFVPCRFAAQGSRPRKLEPNRHRRIQNDSAPERDLFDTDGVPVVSLNRAVALRAVHTEDWGVHDRAVVASDAPDATPAERARLR
ncbi:MAG: hypothetical protein AAGF99_15830, partial [Bacteroidota bacterium]